MAYPYYNRYSEFTINGEQTIVPYVTIPAKTTDQSYIYKVGQSRLDRISQQFYSSPVFGWLILQANPLVGSIEFEIPDNFILRVPFPLTTSLQDYKRNIELYSLYYGEE